MNGLDRPDACNTLACGGCERCARAGDVRPGAGAVGVARPGQGLSQFRAPLESVFGQDFSNVRLHRDGLADAYRARAVTLGDDVHVAPSEGSLSAPGARALVAHELAHVIQQRRLVGNSARSPADLEREAEGAAAAAAAGRRATVKGSVAGAGSTPQLAPKLAPAPPSGNILYVGMNNADPEIKSLLGRYPSGSSVDVTVIKATEEESATAVGSTTFDLTGDAGINALAKSLTSEAAKQTALARTLKAQAKEDRDDLAHVAKVYADTEADGKDRVRGSSSRGTVAAWGCSAPRARSTSARSSSLRACSPRRRARPSTSSWPAVTPATRARSSTTTSRPTPRSSPSGPGGTRARRAPARRPPITTWARLTEHGETTLPKQGGAGIATWSGGVYQGSPSAKAPVSSVLSSVRSDDARFQEYLDGTRAEGPHGGWLEAYYGRVFASGAPARHHRRRPRRDGAETTARTAPPLLEERREALLGEERRSDRQGLRHGDRPRLRQPVPQGHAEGDRGLRDDRDRTPPTRPPRPRCSTG